MLPPIARGDLDLLPESIETVLVVDGYFGTQPSVGHLELLETMRRRKVYGCASMGAIRAYELRNDGMVGVGRVYDSFFDHEDFMDDEVALLHAPSPYYWPLSLPLVNIRFALQEMVDSEIVLPTVARRVVDRLKRMYFGVRTLECVLQLLEQDVAPDLLPRARSMLSSLDAKRDDFVRALDLLVGLKDG
ncbi:TfuA-like protein [Paraburkholderia nemoris]|uniref:TfuA-like protein n=1 Tax=Paraburkholderia nemoris TaxID=2793076 RepID=UPI0038BBDFE8